MNQQTPKKKPRPVPVPVPHLKGLSDAHTHISSCGAWTPEEAQPLIQRAAAAGVERICTVGDGLDECGAAFAIADNIDGIYAAVALHPTRANELNEQAKAQLVEWAEQPAVVAIGETGLDTYWIDKSDTCAPLDVQIEALAWHCELAKKVGKTLMIHNREADQQLLDELARLDTPEHVMLHCFSSPIEVAEEALARGYILSFTGNVTFKNNHHLREAARLAPAGQLLVETDAPYMTPEPYRGRKNESALIGHTFVAIAEQRQQSVEELAREVMDTFNKVYGLSESDGSLTVS